MTRRILGYGLGIVCCAVLTPAIYAVQGDCHHDCRLDLADFVVFQTCFTGGGGAECTCADLDGDGSVDLADYGGLVAAMAGPDQTVPPATLELAGNSLTGYPFFEYVRAFNQGGSIEIAVDPNLHPDVVGLACNLYVVQARSVAEWAADSSLIDVRPSGPQPVSFTSGTIQDNTILITEASTLSGDAGIDIGVGYDLVLDCDLDGELDCDDFIDGYGDEAGCYVVHDITTLGPLATTTITYSGGSYLSQQTVYPTAIASMGQLPLVTISPGLGTPYSEYSYLQEHLASYGMVVMAHVDGSIAGVDQAASTTINNTDFILSNQGTIAGGVLNGHLDSSAIVWIGRGRSGEGVVRAYDKLWEGSSTPVNFGASDILLVSSIAPTGFLSAYDAHPHDVTYHLLYGSADTYMTGCPLGDANQPFIIFERAEAYRHSTYVHGAGHSDWLDDAAPDYAGPDPIGHEEAHRIAKAVYLALIKHYAEGNIPAKDFLWRQWEHFKPIGVSPDTTVVNEYRAGPDGVNFVIDDHESQPNPDTSSSGGAVTFDVSNLTEDRIDDADTVLTWTPSDPMNGMTRDGVNDTGRGVVFDWSEGGSYFYEYEIISAERDFSDDTYLSFRACQGTRHPETIAELADLTFTVTLRDTGGTTSSINFGVYGGGIEEPYQRDGCGEGVGWQNEFETVRIRLTDFLTNGSGLDLTGIEAVRFEFGQGFGSSQGRLGVDNVELTTD